MSYTFTLPALSASILTPLNPRKPRHRRLTFLALFALVGISLYIFFVARPTLAMSPVRALRSQSSQPQHGPAPQDKNTPHSRLFKFPNAPKQTNSHLDAPQIQLTPDQELAAVTNHLASLYQNVVPSWVDPSKPIDPQLVLDFDTRGPRAQDELNEIVNEVWIRNPVVVFSKLYHSRSRNLKSKLNNLNLSPPPTIFEVDQRPDASVLTPLLERLTGSSDLPLVLVGGKVVPAKQQEEDTLKVLVSAAGAIVDGGKKKKGRK